MIQIANEFNIDELLSKILPDCEEPEFIVVDLFCGAGGTTTGIEMARRMGVKVAKVIACVNHDHLAIQSHWENHPDVFHFLEDIRTLNLSPLIKIVDFYRRLYPNAKLILWASLECTNFSKAKGGQPRDADSRTLANDLKRYIAAIDPDYIQIENVVEFMSWGPLISVTVKTKEGFLACPIKIVPMYGDKPRIFDEELYEDQKEFENIQQTGWKVLWKGVPESKKNGRDWMRWRREICEMVYQDDWKELNSANFGAYTSRNRLFGIFARPDIPIVWPQPTHAKSLANGSMFSSNLEKWKAVKEVLNFKDEGKSIFNRKKPLSDKTLERIYAGLVKYVAKGDTAFLSKYFSGRPKGKVNSVDVPGPTVTCFGGTTLVQAMHYSDIPVDHPAGTITTKDHHALVQAQFLLKYNSMNEDGKHTPPSVDDPCPTVACQPRLGLVQPAFLASYNSKGDNVSSTDNPSPTLVTKDRIALVQPQYFIDKHYRATQNQSVESPAGTILTNDKHRLVEVDPFIMPTNYNNLPKSIEEPSPTITANRKHHYLVNPSWGGNPGSVDQPCCVVVARQDKAPLYLIQVEGGEVLVPVYEGDSEVMIRIKEFMAFFKLKDIKMRMLRVLELLKIQGFPADYKLAGNQTDQKKFIGNSVVPDVVKAWYEAMAEKFSELKQQVA